MNVIFYEGHLSLPPENSQIYNVAAKHMHIKQISISLAALAAYRRRILNGKGITMAAILFMGVVGYLLAPADLAPGEYETEIVIGLAGRSLTVDRSIRIGGETGEATSREYRFGSMLVLTGVSDWLALRLAGLTHLPGPLVIFLVAGFTLVIGAFISNTACAAMLIPLAIPLAQILQLDPRLLVAVVATASSIDFALVIGTPPTMLAYSTGLFETKEIFRRGVLLDLAGIVILSFLVIWIWDLLGAVVLV